jgi:hypothetical protein
VAVTLEGLDLAIDEIHELRAEVRAIRAKLDALSTSNGHNEVGYYDAERAAVYLSLSKEAVERAWRRGTIASVLTANGLRRSSKQMLDAYAQGRRNGVKP